MNSVDSTITAGIASSLALISVAALVLVPSLSARIIDSFAFILTVGAMLIVPLFLFAGAAIAFLMGNGWLGNLFLVITAGSEPICMTVLIVLGFAVLHREKRP